MDAYLKKFIAIDNVGRLASCKQKGPELNKYNLIFAENGRGKTTLCAVLRSLETGRHEFITERKTISPTAADPSATIRVDGGEARYHKQTWNKTVSEIAIFDSTFVSQNVHSGEFVGRDQRTNLLEVIIGEEGVTLSNQVNKLDDDIRDKNSEIGRSKKALEVLVPRGLSLEKFLSLAEDPEIEKKIADKEGALKTAQEAQLIGERAALKMVSKPALPENFSAVLGKTLNDISADAERRLAEQLTRHDMHENGQEWLFEGVRYLAHDACPFCGQNVKGLDLVEAYKQYFSEVYLALITDIDNVGEGLELALGKAAIASLGRDLAENDAGLEFWKQHVNAKVDVKDFSTDLAKPFSALSIAAAAMVRRKKANPLDAVQADGEFQNISNNAKNASDKLSAYNISIESINASISEKKKEAAGADSARISSELAVLKLVQLRHGTKMKPLCQTHLELVRDKDDLDKAKDQAKKALDDHADRMIGQYEATINDLLKGFGAGFSLTNSKKTYAGGKPTSAYQILINNKAIDLGDVTTRTGEPSFRTTLSAGDKSTLALAFFLAKLDHDPKKSDRIIVFDDPFNSQDRSRRERTAELLKRYGCKCRQLLLFSHDPFFLSLVYSKLPKAERHSLQLSRVPHNYSTIEEWDVEKETQDGYFKDHAALSSYLLSGSKELIDIVRKIRPVLEGYMRYRFPNKFPPDQWLGDMIAHIRTTGAAHPMYDALADLEGINDYSKKYHHDTNPGKADSESLDDGELSAYVRRTLAIVGGY